MGITPLTSPTHPADLIKEVLRDRHISQKDFAKLVDIRPSHLNDILNRRRRISDEFALEVEKWLAIPARSLLEMQATFNITEGASQKDEVAKREEERAKVLLESFDQFVSVDTLIKKLKLKRRTAVEKLEILTRVYNLTPEYRFEFNLVADGNFRKSAKNGLDERMIATWILIAKSSVSTIRPKNRFDHNFRKEVCRGVANLLHSNKGNLISDLTNFLDTYGIVFRRVEKVDKASIDGFSFFSDSDTPCIVVTCRYDRIDNLAFTVMHELGHIYLNHTTPAKPRINIDTRSVNDEADADNKTERAADVFASETLIPSSYWNSAPPVPLNPFKIQTIYSEWANKLHLNKWIVLGHVSHVTGMYKFRTDETRKISGGKEVMVS